MVAKQIADFITLVRSVLLMLMPWLALTYGEESLPWAAALLAADWTGDSLDGSLARRSPLRAQTWIGDHDLEIDIAVSVGVLLYMWINRYVQTVVIAIYLGIWAAYFLRRGLPRAMGMLFQAPIFAWFIYTALVEAPNAGWLLVAWILAAVVLTWPRFPKEIVPGFLEGMRSAFQQD